MKIFVESSNLGLILFRSSYNNISQPNDILHSIFTANNYPCKHYQLLTDETRIATYRSKYNNYCDRRMYGWYRFWGEAGHRMLEHCPLFDDQKLFPCGSYFQGWLNATNPVPLDGTVNRTICFSNIASCACDNRLTRQIQMRHCGRYFVYKLSGLHDICERNIANKARYCGMRGKDTVLS